MKGHLIYRPLITEKSLTLAARGWYTFLVSLAATKEAVARAVAKFYNVTVTDVRTSHMHGKTRRVGRSMKYVKRIDSKKAIVRLAKGQKIDVFEVTTQQQDEPKAEKPRKAAK
jgi:ribosomal protein L23